MDAFLQLAQSIDPTELGRELGQAQNVQQILGTIVGVLVAVVLALVYFYLKERRSWTEQQVKAITDAAQEKEDILARWSGSKVEWEQERTKHAEVQLATKDQAADEKEGLMREMLDLVLRVEQALKALAELKRGTE